MDLAIGSTVDKEIKSEDCQYDLLYLPLLCWRVSVFLLFSI